VNSSKRRYCDKALPEYAHRPGLTVHPHKPGGHSFAQEEKLAPPLTDFRIHQDYLWGIDCLNHGYYWEAHTAFEAIWNAHLRTGATADLMKALIKISAAALKLEAQSIEASRGHLQRAQELIQPLTTSDLIFVGLEKKSLEDWLEQALAQKELQINLRLDLIF